MMSARTLTTKKGKSVETSLTNVEALDVLRSIAHPTKFAADLLRQAGNRGLSHDQFVWVHILAIEELRHREEKEHNGFGDTAVEPENEVGFDAAIVYLRRARDAGLKYPKVRLVDATGQRVVLGLAGPKSRSPGTVNLTDGGPFGENAWFGRVEADGAFSRSRQCTDDVRDALRAFCDDPAATAKANGALTGRCCFCGKTLETRESVGAGYGPICAGKYGLPWGAETAAQYVDARAAAIAEAEAAVAVSEQSVAVDDPIDVTSLSTPTSLPSGTGALSALADLFMDPSIDD